jgi:hypothetical protein
VGAEWADVFPDMPPNLVREAFDRCLADLGDPARRWTLQDSINMVLLAGKFRAEVWTRLEASERAYYSERIAELKARMGR